MRRWSCGWVLGALLAATGFASAQCPQVQSLSVVSNCTTEQIDVSWNNPVPYDELVVRAIDIDLGVEVAEVTLPAFPGVPTPSEASLDVPAGNYNIQVTGVCPTAESTANRLHGHAVGFTERTNLLLSLEGSGGANNSAEEWGLFFGATSKSYVRVPSFSAVCPDTLQPGDVVWVCCGTFPDNHVLTFDEGVLLTEWVLSGVSVYLEGANLWGFDPLTPYADYDGVAGRFGAPSPIEDGDDSCQFISGLAHAGLDLTGWAAPYDQDQTDDDSTDRLVPTGTLGFPVDLSGANAGLIVEKSGPPGPNYGVAIYYVPGGPAPLGLPIEGKRVSSSVELGKADDGTKQEVSLCLKGVVDNNFIRGDCNGDGTCNLADAIRILEFLFLGGASDCLDACDVNDDGGIDLGDAIAKVNFLFSGGPPPLPPTGSCGPDVGADLLPCAEPSDGC